MDWNNPWVVGIGTGVLSGALVGWITHAILARGENKEYHQRIEAANRDVIYAIRPGISEGQIPTREVIKALIAATARQYSLSASDLFAPPQLAEELIKEVMDSSFLSSKQKSNYCEGLAPLRTEQSQVRIIDVEQVTSGALATYRRSFVRMMSVILGLVSSFTAVLLSFAKLRAEHPESDWVNFVSDLGPVAPILLPVLFTLSALILSLLLFSRFREVNKKEKQHVTQKASADTEKDKLSV